VSSKSKTENYGLCQYANSDIPDWRSDYTGDMAIIDATLAKLSTKGNETDKTIETIQGEIEDVKKSVSDGKELVASAVTAKGVDTEPDATFAEIALNINAIVINMEYPNAVDESLEDEVAAYSGVVDESLEDEVTYEKS